MNATNARTKWWLMAISIALGGVSAWALDRHLHEKSEEIESRSRLEQVTLLVAARDLTPETILEEADLMTESFPVKWASDEALTPEHVDSVLGKRLLTEVRAGQPLMHLHLLDVEAPSVSSRLRPSHKAFSIVVDTASTDSGLIRQGDHVDLFVSFDYQGRRMTAALLQAVEVLAAAQRSQQLLRGDSTPSSLSSAEASITVAISQTDVVKLVAAREAGSISAVLSSSEPPRLTESFHPASGDLAALLGLQVNAPQRIVPILYGDRLVSDHDHPQEVTNSAEVGRSTDILKYSAAYK